MNKGTDAKDHFSSKVLFECNKLSFVGKLLPQLSILPGADATLSIGPYGEYLHTVAGSLLMDPGENNILRKHPLSVTIKPAVFQKLSTALSNLVPENAELPPAAFQGALEGILARL